ncbi:sigma-70 family RNA polymerase sigma factor [Salinimicrobium sp. TIG7-5_MAKvit]|uniref:RNA polymerase sigma factor n=3 Tax=Flavobacteriales TaxID=200644 RepID=UPI001F4916BC|nr:sigma-70 family RNA polymerase sigma factor [Antarcticibacterium sp. 1MA-6-2]UJH91919.1 sigma-70 family RNA polymerase sigma factor [Antarcticibacterium sp. 1MA-6-2]
MSQHNFNLLKNGDPTALEHIHARYHRSIFWVGRGILDDDFVVSSLVQDSFLKLWVHRDRIETPKHIYFFLRMVMQRECYSYYTLPRTKFFSKVNSLDSYENFQEYLGGYDPISDLENFRDQEREQKAFEKIINVLPLLTAERRHLIDLCLKYGFRYKEISKVMGTSIPETFNEVQLAISDLKNIINPDSVAQTKQKPAMVIKVQANMTPEQEEVFRLRNEKKFSFASIAAELKLSQKEVHKEFMIAYKIMQEKHEQQQQIA